MIKERTKNLVVTFARYNTDTIFDHHIQVIHPEFFTLDRAPGPVSCPVQTPEDSDRGLWNDLCTDVQGLTNSTKVAADCS